MAIDKTNHTPLPNLLCYLTELTELQAQFAELNTAWAKAFDHSANSDRATIRDIKSRLYELKYQIVELNEKIAALMA